MGAESEDAPTVSVVLDGLDPRDLHLVSLRLHPPLPTYEQGLRAMSHLRFEIGHTALTGLLSSHAVAGRWVHAALPPRAADAPAAILDGIGRGSLVGLSQLLVRRLPCRFQEARIAEEQVVIPLETVAPDFVLPLTVLLRAGDHVSAPRIAGGPGSPPAELRFALPPEGSGPLTLEILGPEVVLADFKCLLALSPEARVLDPARDRGAALESPGLFVIDLDPERHRGATLLSLGAAHLPPGAVQLELLQADGNPVPDGAFVLDTPAGPVPLVGGRALLPAPAGAAPLGVRFVGTEPLQVDRVLALAPLRWILPLPLTR